MVIDMVLFGMVWWVWYGGYGIVCYDVVWYGMVLVWCAMVCYGIV